MPHLLIFGLGYTASRVAARVRELGWQVTATRRSAEGAVLALDDAAGVSDAIAAASHILCSVPPDPAGVDPVLARYGADLAGCGAWIGYLSSTGVYGDTGGAWVDETAPCAGRRGGRIAADRAWRALPEAHVFRLPGIYGPGRSALDRIADGRAHRIDLPGQVFSRIHVDDIVAAVLAAMANGTSGTYNIADDAPAAQNDVVAYAAALLGRAPPPVQALDAAGLSPAARAFYAENRRVSATKARRLLGWRPRYLTYRAGLRAILDGQEAGVIP